jgi:rRNA maturation endonuclease Nob1
MGKKSRFNLACLDCGDDFTAKNELAQCPSCGGPGELSVSNFEDSGWADSEDQEDLDVDKLSYDPSLFD